MMPAGKTLYRSLYWKSLQFLASFCLNIVIARTFRSAITAEFYYLVYLLSLCISLFTMGLDISISYYLPRSVLSPATAGRLILLVTGLALLICLPVLACWIHPAQFPDLDRPRILLFAGLQIAGGLLTTLAGTLFTAFGRNDLPSKIACILNTILVIGCAVCGWIINNPNPEFIRGFFAAWFGFSFLQGVFLFLLADRRYGIFRARPQQSTASVQPSPGSPFIPARPASSSIASPASSPASPQSSTSSQSPASSQSSTGPASSTSSQSAHIHLRDILRFSFAAFIINFIFFLGSRLTLYLMPYRLGPADQGNYIQAYKLVEYLGLLMSFLYYPVIVLVAGTAKEKMQQTILLLVRISNTAILLFSIIVLITGRWLFPLLFGPSFSNVYTIFTGFIPGVFAVCSSGFFTAWYFGSGHIKYNGVSAGIQLVAMGAGFLIFPAPLGTALAFSLASLLSLGYDLWVFRQFYRWSLREIVFIRPSDWQTIRSVLQRLPGASLLKR